MKRLVFLLALTALTGCRYYQYYPRVSDQDGLVPADIFATYGREQAILVAVGREYARPYNSGPVIQAKVAMAYARKFSDVVNITADPLGHRLTIEFDSGWIAAVVPIADNKTGDETTIPS